MKHFFTFMLLVFVFYGCNTTTSDSGSTDNTESVTKSDSLPKDNSNSNTPFVKDLDEIKKEGVLRAIVIYSSTSYFLYKGEVMGFEYELLNGLAKDLGLELDIVVVNDIDQLFEELLKGNADLVAHGLTITKKRKETVAFTDYLYLTKQVLVQKKPDNWRQMNWAKLDRSLIHDAIELIGDTVTVRENSSYYERLKNLSNELGGNIHIAVAPGEETTDGLIDQVVNGEIKYTVADDYLAKLQASYYADLNVKVPLSFSQRIAWAVRPSSPKLLSAINSWVAKARKDVDYIVTYRKYFKNTKSFKRRIKSDFYSLNKNQISKYDDIIKKRAEYIGWDWRLLASQIYQESMFDPNTKSWVGARGLMQIMPKTAAELGVKNITDPTENIIGGTKYLKQLYNRYEWVPDETQRIKFTLGAYNCGLGHVDDAISMATKNGLDKNKWDGNVAEMVLKLSKAENYRQRPPVKHGYVNGFQPYNYVNEIFMRYQHYCDFIKK